jgi:PAS domain-containing protein
MRDHLRPKQELVSEVIGLRKQVADLKEATAVRRRVEDALRHSEGQLRVLLDCAPVGLCLFRPDGAPISTNCPFARILGYDSPAELVSMTQVLGMFATPEEQDRVMALLERKERVGDVLLRRKDGKPYAAWVMAAVCHQPDVIALVVLEPQSQPDSFSTAWRADMPGG